MKSVPATKEVEDWSKATAGLLPDFHGTIKAGQGTRPDLGIAGTKLAPSLKRLTLTAAA